MYFHRSFPSWSLFYVLMFCNNIEKFTKFLSVKQNCYKDKMVPCYFKEMLRLERSMLWLTFKTSTAALQCMGRDVINSANLFHMLLELFNCKSALWTSKLMPLLPVCVRVHWAKCRRAMVRVADLFLLKPVSRWQKLVLCCGCVMAASGHCCLSGKDWEGAQWHLPPTVWTTPCASRSVQKINRPVLYDPNLKKGPDVCCRG